MAIQNTSFEYSNAILTTNTTPTAILSHTVYEKESGFLTYKVVCQRLSDGATKAWTVHGSLKRLTGQNPSTSTQLLGSVLGTAGDQLALLSASAGFTYDSTNIILQVTGLNTNLIWWAELEGHVLSDDGN